MATKFTAVEEGSYDWPPIGLQGMMLLLNSFLNPTKLVITLTPALFQLRR